MALAGIASIQWRELPNTEYVRSVHEGAVAGKSIDTMLSEFRTDILRGGRECRRGGVPVLECMGVFYDRIVYICIQKWHFYAKISEEMPFLDIY